MVAAVAVPDQPVEASDSGGQVGPMSFVDKQSSNGTELVAVQGRKLDPFDAFDIVFIHGA